MSRLSASSWKARFLILVIPIPFFLLMGFFLLVYADNEIFKTIKTSYANKLVVLSDNIQKTNEKILREKKPCNSINKQTAFDDVRRDFILINANKEIECATINKFDSEVLLDMIHNGEDKNTIMYKNIIGFINSKNDYTIISVVNEYYLRVVFGFYADDKVMAVKISPGSSYLYNKIESINKTKRNIFISSDNYKFGIDIYLGGDYLYDIYVNCFLLVIILSLLFSFLYLIIEPQFRTSLIKELNKAIDDEELYLVYHSLSNSRDHYLIGYESLIRWEHPKLGVVRPDYFIPIAEKFGLINKLTYYIFEQAYKDWLSVERNMSVVLLLGINIPPDFLLDENSIKTIKDYMVKFSKLNIALVLEITENQTIFPEQIKVINALVDDGVMIAIDDFGTGQTSLSMLQNTKINFLKIDKTFVDAIESEYMNTCVLDSIIKLSYDLEIVVIAEGVETKKQSEYLLSKGVEVQQGYYFSMPKEISAIYSQSSHQ